MHRHISERSTENAALLVDLGLVDAIMTALRAHSGSAEVLEAAARALAVVIDCTDTLAVVDAEGMFNTSMSLLPFYNAFRECYRFLEFGASLRFVMS